MNNFENTSRAFIAARVTGDLLGQLGELQRAVYEQVSHEGRKVQSLPKDALTIPIIDLGKPTVESLEAAQLAVDRAINGLSDLSVTLGPAERWPVDGTPSLIQVPATGGVEALNELRGRLAEQLSDYGFEIREGEWHPHIPVSRIRGEGPDFEVPDTTFNTEMCIQSLALLIQGEDRRGRGRFVLKWERNFEAVSATSEGEQSEAEARAEITAQLEARLQQRTTLVRPPRRRLRAKDMEDTIDIDMDGSDATAP